MTDHSFVNEFRTIPDMFRHTIAHWPEREAFRQFDYKADRWVSMSWADYAAEVMRWRRAFTSMGLKKGDRVAMLLTNCIDAVIFDQAALEQGLVPVPLHAIDTPGSAAYILRDSGSRFLVTTARARWNAIAAAAAADSGLPELQRVVFTNDETDAAATAPLLTSQADWLATGESVTDDQLPPPPEAGDLAGLIYTSGTTGRPKGVMITHANITANVRQISGRFDYQETDLFLSYLPFSHTFERTCAHYVALAHGAAMAFARNAAQIEHDLVEVRPTLMCSVPRVYEKIYQRLQHEIAEAPADYQRRARWCTEIGWRRFCENNALPVESGPREPLDSTAWPELDAEIGTYVRSVFGGRLRATFAGGASLSYAVSRFFCAMGLNIRQAYGLTETSPVVSFPRTENNHPATVGHPVDECEVKLGANDELLVRGPQVMTGYWNKPRETAEAFEDGWFRTGDQADLSDGGRVRIKGRLKEIIVTSTGEKIAPVDVEFAIVEDRLFEQALVYGDNAPYVAALTVVHEGSWRALCEEHGLDPDEPSTQTDKNIQRALVRRIRQACRDFPQYGIPRAVGVIREPWTIDNGMLTPTQKLRRREIATRYSALLESLYASANGR